VTRALSRARSANRRFDAAVDDAFDHLRGHPAVDRLYYAASELGDFSLIWIMLGCLRGLRSDPRGRRAAMRLFGGLITDSCIINGGVKTLFRRKRPPWEVDRPHRIRRPLTSSFPSGHATSSFLAAVLLSEDDPLWPLYWATAGVVSTSRVYVRIHHASDVVAGAALGVVMGLAIRGLVPLDPLARPEPGHAAAAVAPNPGGEAPAS